MAETLDLSLFVEPGDAGASHMTLAVEGVSCAGCIRKIENGLNKLPGVIDARLNFTQRRLAVDWRNDETDAAKIIAAIETIGYHAHPFAPERADADESAQAKWLMKCLAVAGFAAMNIMPAYGGQRRICDRDSKAEGRRSVTRIHGGPHLSATSKTQQDRSTECADGDLQRIPQEEGHEAESEDRLVPAGHGARAKGGPEDRSPLCQGASRRRPREASVPSRDPPGRRRGSPQGDSQ